MRVHRIVVGLMSVVAALGVGTAAAQVGATRDEAAPGLGAPQTATTQIASRHVVGRVLGPDGAPAVGAVVVTSAGGQAVTVADGSFDLTVQLPLDAANIRVTAVMGSGTGSLVGSAQIGGLTRWGTTEAATLVLAKASGCQPSWLPTFGQTGVYGGVSVLAVFDDGGGPALYAGGSFTKAGGVATGCIARWNGSTWSALGSGVNHSVFALAVFDDGSGPALYAGGLFHLTYGAPADGIAKWDGTSWSPVGGGVDSLGSVSALSVFDDGSGPALYVGGTFSMAGTVAAHNVARWDGTSWSALGVGLDQDVFTLCGFDDGSGATIYAGGYFTSSGGSPVDHVAKWNGSTWEPVGGGMNDSVNVLRLFDDGNGPALYAGGYFTTAGGPPANHVARWDGSSWSTLGSGCEGLGPTVVDLIEFDDGTGAALYAAGSFSTAGGEPATGIARWDGSDWSAVGCGSNGIGALAVFDDGSGPTLFADAMKWVRPRWEPLTDGLNDRVGVLTVLDDGTGAALYAGGGFQLAGPSVANHVAKWDGSSWSPLGGGLPNDVEAFAVFDDGGGPALFAGGYFFEGPRKWDGSGWSPTFNGPFGEILALAIFDDGSGPALFMGGGFGDAGGVGAKNIVKWDGSTWSVVGGSLNGNVDALAVFDDGSGPALYAGGSFMYVGGPQFIAKWDGSAWSAVGAGLSGGAVNALTVYDLGDGPALYAGGGFSAAGGAAAKNVAKWDGSSWSALGDGVSGGQVIDLVGFDDGSGPALYAGGSFTSAGSVGAKRIAKWDGSSWSELGSGAGDVVAALAVFDDGNGPGLYVGGSFTSMPDSLDSYVAKWAGCPVTWTWMDLGFALPGVAGLPALAGTGELAAGSRGTLTLSDAAASAPTTLFLSLASTPASFKGGTLAPVPVLWGLGGVTDAFGTIDLEFHWPPGIPGGTSIFFQYAIADAGAVQGVALSNALRADVP